MRAFNKKYFTTLPPNRIGCSVIFDVLFDIGQKSVNKRRILWLYKLKPILSRRVAVYRTAHFNAAHRLHVPQWSDSENQRFFGLCNNQNYHGHNYEIVVRVEGEVDEVSGYLIDMKILKGYIEEEVTDAFDHKNLNLDVPEFKELNPTAENIVWVIYNKIKNRLDASYTLSVRLYETPRNFVEFNG